jgi:hypothetical protein
MELQPEFVINCRHHNQSTRVWVSFIPAVRERVFIEGRDEVFLVVSIDPERRVADLIPINDGGQPAEEIPLSSLRRAAPIPEAAD